MLQWVDRVSRLQLVLQLSDEQCLRGAGQQLACQLLEILMVQRVGREQEGGDEGGRDL